MRSLWRRFMAWPKPPDVWPEPAHAFGRVRLRDGTLIPVLDSFNLEAAERHLSNLKLIGASPQAIDIAEQVLEAYRTRENA